MDADAVAARLAAMTGASAEIIASVLRQEIAADEAQAHRHERRERVAT